MKYYEVVHPDENGNTVKEVWNEIDILDHYWEYWYEAMIRKGERARITVDNCIKDWVTVNWAVFVKED